MVGKKGMLIEPSGKVSMVKVDSIEQMYDALKCKTFDARGTRYPVSVYFDDEFLLKDTQPEELNATGTLLAAMLTGPDFPSIYGNMLFVQEDQADSVDMDKEVKQGLLGAIYYITLTANRAVQL